VLIPTTGQESDAKIYNYVARLLYDSTFSTIFSEVFDKEKEK